MIDTDENQLKKISNSILSADYYLRKCDNIWPKNISDFEKVLNYFFESQKPKLSLFLAGRDAIQIFSNFKSEVSKGTVSIYIHRDDNVPQTCLMKKMALLGFELFSINWLGSIEYCKPIPIGIPSITHRNALANRAFIEKLIEKIGTSDSSLQTEKQFKFYVNFDITTNVILRKSALLNFLGADRTFIPTRKLTPMEHFDAICQSEFVISPPGAGIDCYRTWEALYLGSTPVVLEDNWPFKSWDLPVITLPTLDPIFFSNSKMLVQKNTSLENVDLLFQNFG